MSSCATILLICCSLFSPSGFGGGTDNEDDRVTTYVYNGIGQVLFLLAHNPSTAQVTTYEYKDDYDASLVTRVIYPDGDTSDNNVEYTYHLDGSPATRKDQRGVVLTYHYNERRQVKAQTADLTDLVSGQSVDGSILSITRQYDDLGRTTHVTSHGNLTSNPVDTSDVENQILYGYHPTYGTHLITRQSHQGVATSAPAIVYLVDTEVDMDDRFVNAVRPKSVIYPSSRKCRHTAFVPARKSGKKPSLARFPTFSRLSARNCPPGPVDSP